jgi:hypothetical protein
MRALGLTAEMALPVGGVSGLRQGASVFGKAYRASGAERVEEAGRAAVRRLAP